MMMLANSQDTIIALSTANAASAIAVIRLSGSEALNVVKPFWKGKSLDSISPNQALYGTISDENNQLIDEVVLTYFKAPYSYTKEHVVEISCHGSIFIIRKLIGLFLKKGIRLAEPGEFTKRAFLNGRFDLSQAEAVADIIASESAAEHQLAMNQLKGGVSNQIKSLRDELINFTALLELELDFSEEDVEFADRSRFLSLVETTSLLIQQLLESFTLGNAIKKGVNTVIAGRPNAGKSTLLNALLDEERAIVSEIAGTTRDTIEETLVINGITFRIIDTAGIREATDQIEAIGVEKTYEKIKTSSILVYLFDINALSFEEVNEDLKKLERENLNLVVVGNKTDSVKEKNHHLHFNPHKFIGISAKNKHNISELKEMIYSCVAENLNFSSNVIISNSRHYECLLKAKESIQRVKDGLNNQLGSELIAEDLRETIRNLGNITGEVDVDKDILGTIFGRFCIGK
ncbi:MAG: tRNA uridine-5-carboxymethylaminomethyl(34) synthesis GTPase MnmE [Cytophagales bacterium]